MYCFTSPDWRIKGVAAARQRSAITLPRPGTTREDNRQNSRSDAVDASHGPFFGTAQHFVVVGKTGFSETRDGGQTWQVVAPLPAGFGINRVGPNYAWDSRADIFYASTMTKPTFKFERSKK